MSEERKTTGEELGSLEQFAGESSLERRRSRSGSELSPATPGREGHALGEPGGPGVASPTDSPEAFDRPSSAEQEPGLAREAGLARQGTSIPASPPADKPGRQLPEDGRTGISEHPPTPHHPERNAAPSQPASPPARPHGGELLRPEAEPSATGPDTLDAGWQPTPEELDPDTDAFWGDEGEEEWEDAAGPEVPPERPIDPSDWAGDPVVPPNLVARKRGALAKKPEGPRLPLSPQQKLLLLDTWQRSGLPARDFGALIHMSRHTLYAWKRRFELEGPAGLMEKPRRQKKAASQLSEIAKRAILMLKQAHPDWGCERISDMLARGPALGASPSSVSRVLHEAGYTLEEQPTRRHPDKVRRFERARPNQLWQTDLFTFVLKRQNRRVHLVAFMDDHSRFITGYGLHATQSSALVLEVLRSAIASYGAPQEILTDNGAQYVTWRGKSQFTKELEKRGIKQIVAKPRRPQTLGKIERFWGTLWRECLEAAVFLDMADARQRIGLFLDYYNFQRTHSGIDGLYPADRFFEAAPEVQKTMRARLAANALELARHGVPKKPFYLTGQLDGKPFSVHQEGDRVILRQAGQEREEIELTQPPQDASAERVEEGDERLPAAICPDGSPQTAWNPPDAEPAPGVSPLDTFLPLVDESEPLEEGGAS